MLRQSVEAWSSRRANRVFIGRKRTPVRRDPALHADCCVLGFCLALYHEQDLMAVNTSESGCRSSHKEWLWR